MHVFFLLKISTTIREGVGEIVATDLKKIKIGSC